MKIFFAALIKFKVKSQDYLSILFCLITMRVSLLDGVLDKWKKEGHTIETKTNSYVKTNYRRKPNSSVLATAGEIKKSMGKKGTALLDSRTKEEFEGILVRAGRAGHIPSAIVIDGKKIFMVENLKQKKNYPSFIQKFLKIPM